MKIDKLGKWNTGIPFLMLNKKLMNSRLWRSIGCAAAAAMMQYTIFDITFEICTTHYHDEPTIMKMQLIKKKLLACNKLRNSTHNGRQALQLRLEPWNEVSVKGPHGFKHTRKNSTNPFLNLPNNMVPPLKLLTQWDLLSQNCQLKGPCSPKSTTNRCLL